MSCSQMLLAERLSSHAASGPRPRQSVPADASIRSGRRARHGQVPTLSAIQCSISTTYQQAVVDLATISARCEC